MALIIVREERILTFLNRILKNIFKNSQFSNTLFQPNFPYLEKEESCLKRSLFCVDVLLKFPPTPNKFIPELVCFKLSMHSISSKCTSIAGYINGSNQ
jgi:hypothetical protein